MPVATAPAEYRDAVPLDRVHPHPANVRRDTGDLVELTASVAQVGILEPLVVTPHPNRVDAYVVIAGHRRLAAAQAADLTTVPCRIRRDLTSTVDITVAMLAENLHRMDITPIEEATAYEQLAIAGLTTTDIARRVGRDRGLVAGRRRLLDLPETLRDKIHARQLSITDAEALTEFADDPGRLAVLEHAAGTNQLRYELERARVSRDGERKRAAARAHWQALGVQILTGAQARDMWGHSLGHLGLLTGTSDDRAGQEEEHTRTCPAAAVHITPGAYTEHFCTDPALHGATAPGTPGPAPSPAPTATSPTDAHTTPPVATPAPAMNRNPETAPTVDQDAADTEACEVAARLRRRHVQDLVTGQTALTDEMRTAITRHAVLAGIATTELFADVVLEDAADLLGIDTSPVQGTDYIDMTALEALVARHVATARDPHAVLLALVALTAEAQLDSRWAWRPGRLMSPETPGGLWAWLRLLGGPLAYEWTGWEAERIDAITTQTAA